MTRPCDEILHKVLTQGMITMADLGKGCAPL